MPKPPVSVLFRSSQVGEFLSPEQKRSAIANLTKRAKFVIFVCLFVIVVVAVAIVATVWKREEEPVARWLGAVTGLILILIETVHSALLVTMDRKWYAKQEQKALEKKQKVVSIIRALLFIGQMLAIAVLTALEPTGPAAFWIRYLIYVPLTFLVLCVIGVEHHVLANIHVHLHPLHREQCNKEPVEVSEH
ncbi:unnamed protein product [Caenorhabditis sp. 36 PRJEB53466]|nr:unnamed protein product [Caenorhabditis sp. 36 PRJEB53466]